MSRIGGIHALRIIAVFRLARCRRSNCKHTRQGGQVRVHSIFSAYLFAVANEDEIFCFRFADERFFNRRIESVFVFKRNNQIAVTLGVKLVCRHFEIYADAVPERGFDNRRPDAAVLHDGRVRNITIFNIFINFFVNRFQFLEIGHGVSVFRYGNMIEFFSAL